ncbi:MAG: hypothetical protein U0Z44_00035 [Kouleothrix sp.]|nr:hypothetical protein [Aquabacterium sp.]
MHAIAGVAADCSVVLAHAQGEQARLRFRISAATCDVPLAHDHIEHRPPLDDGERSTLVAQSRQAVIPNGAHCDAECLILAVYRIGPSQERRN